MRGTVPAALTLAQRVHYYRVLVEDPDANMGDVGDIFGLDYLAGMSGPETDVDQLSQGLTLKLRRAFGAPSQNLVLSPPHEASLINRNAANDYAPRIDHSRAVDVYTAILAAPGTPGPSDWHKVFAGSVQRLSLASAAMEFQCQDRFAQLLKLEISETRTYAADAPTAAETVLQQILDDNLEPYASVTLFVPVSPGVMLTQFDVETGQSLGDALADIADKFGWNVRYRWNDAEQDYVLTLFFIDPAATVPVFTFGPGTYFRITRYDIDSSEIVNRIGGSYHAEVTGNLIEAEAVEDTDSIDALGGDPLGVRYRRLEEPLGSPIDSASEWADLANMALAALKDPPTDVEIEVLWNPFLEEGDLIEIEPDGQITDQTIVVAVKGFRGEVGHQRERMVIFGRAQPIGAYYRWRKLLGTGEEGETAVNRATIEAFSISEVNDAEGQRTLTSIVLGPHAARWQLYERDGGDWPTVFGTETGVIDPDPYSVGSFDRSKTQEQRSVAPATTRRAIAIALDAAGNIGDRASASVTTGAGGVGSEPPALLFVAAEQNVTNVRAWWVPNGTITADPGRYVVDVYRDLLIIALDVPAEDEEAFDADAVPCGGGDCEYYQFVYRFVLQDTTAVYDDVEYTYPLAGLWESFSL